MAEALRNVEGEVALIGISNQRLFMRLRPSVTAAARATRTICLGRDGETAPTEEPRLSAQSDRADAAPLCLGQSVGDLISLLQL
jgi:hypothetical protein